MYVLLVGSYVRIKDVKGVLTSQTKGIATFLALLGRREPEADRSLLDAGKMLSSQMYKDLGLASLMRSSMASSSTSSPLYVLALRCSVFSK